MAKRKEYPVRFTPHGLSDAWDSTYAFPGACKSLSNLIFDSGNGELLQARPGVGLPTSSFLGFIAPGAISVMLTVGNLIYGLIATSRNAGKEEPFCWNTTTNSFVSISGVTSANTPTALATTGDVTVPTAAVIGSKLIITHSGFSGAVNVFFGVIDISNPASPAWSCANTATSPLPSVPTCVANFNNRAYFGCGQYLYFSDVLVPTTMTSSTQSLTVGDTSAITAISGLPIQTSSAGIQAGLIAFKSSQIWQINGDSATSSNPLSLNYIALNIGCVSPRTVVQTPIGTLFISSDGPYVVTTLGQVEPLTKGDGKLVQDIQAPFQNVINPSRATASFSASIYRVSLDTTISGVTFNGDYWFDITVGRWNGPHSFSYDCITPIGSSFIISHRLKGPFLFTSQTLPTAKTVYNDWGSPLNVTFQSSMFPKTEEPSVKSVVESAIELGTLGPSSTFIVTAYGENQAKLDSVSVVVNKNLTYWKDGSLWGSSDTWNSTTVQPTTVTLPWTKPLVFVKLSIKIEAVATPNLSIGTFKCKYNDCGYFNI